jgi:hypothetical protein
MDEVQLLRHDLVGPLNMLHHLLEMLSKIYVRHPSARVILNIALPIAGVVVEQYKWFLTALAALLLHVFWAWHARSGVPIARCGAFWILLGMVIIGREIWRMGFMPFTEYLMAGSPPLDTSGRTKATEDGGNIQ